MSMKGVTSPKRVFVVGVGATKFEKPLTKQWDYPDMGREAGIGPTYVECTFYSFKRHILKKYFFM